MDHTERHAAVVALVEESAVLMLRHLSPPGALSLTAVSTLSSLRRRGPARLTALAADEGVSQPSMTQLIQRLEKQGLVRRVPDPGDGRVVLVTITDAGLDLVADRHRARLDQLSGLLDALDPEDEQALVDAAHTALPVLRKLIQHVSV